MAVELKGTPFQSACVQQMRWEIAARVLPQQNRHELLGLQPINLLSLKKTCIVVALFSIMCSQLVRDVKNRPVSFTRSLSKLSFSSCRLTFYTLYSHYFNRNVRTCYWSNVQPISIVSPTLLVLDTWVSLLGEVRYCRVYHLLEQHCLCCGFTYKMIKQKHKKRDRQLINQP
jgi:hypothetical protein